MSRIKTILDTFSPKVSGEPLTKTYQPKPTNPGATVQPKAPLAPAETGSGNSAPPPPAKND